MQLSELIKDYGAFIALTVGLGTTAGFAYRGMKAQLEASFELQKIQPLSDKIDLISKKVTEIDSIVKLSATQTIADKTNELSDSIELEKKKKQFIIEWLSQPFYEADANGYIISLNDSLLGLIGMDRETAIGYGWLNSIAEGHATRVRTEWESAIRHHAIEFETLYRLKKDGKMYRSRAKILRDLTGEVKYIFGTVTPHEKV